MEISKWIKAMARFDLIANLSVKTQDMKQDTLSSRKWVDCNGANSSSSHD